jgi:hypothetical protein
VLQDLTVDIQLALTGVTQTLSVTGEAPVLEATDARIGQVINAEQTVDLPLNGRQFSQLILLSPGAAPKGGSQQAGFTVQLGGGGISPAVNGQTGNFNNFMMDGLDNNSRFANVWAIAPPPDAIQEFKIETGQYAGPNVNIATKPGTDALHGSLWEFLRNDKVDSRNTFDAQKPPYRQNQYGFFAGAPFYIPRVIDGRKTHSWISGYWEGFRSRRSRTYFATVPTPAMLNGDFSSFLGSQAGSDSLGRPINAGQIYNPFTTAPDPAHSGQYLRDPFPGNKIPLSLIPSIGLQYLAHYYPAPNVNTFPNNLVTQQATATDSDQWGVRFDQRLAAADSLFVRANVFDGTSRNPNPLPVNPLFLSNQTRTFGGEYTHVFSPTLILTAVIGYTRDYTPQYTLGVSKDFQQQLGMAQFEPVFLGSREHLHSAADFTSPSVHRDNRAWIVFGRPRLQLQLQCRAYQGRRKPLPERKSDCFEVETHRRTTAQLYGDFHPTIDGASDEHGQYRSGSGQLPVRTADQLSISTINATRGSFGRIEGSDSLLMQS